MPTVRTVTVKSSGGDYSSLSSAEAGEQGDLVSLDRQTDIECYAMSEATTATVSIDGWTTDATRYIRIYAASGQGHSGVWDSSKYNIVRSTDFGAVIGVNENYVRLEGLQLAISSTSANAGAVVSLAQLGTIDNRVDRCIIKNAGTGTGSRGVVIGSSVNSVRNTVIYTASAAAIYIQNVFTAPTVAIDNCTLIGGTYGVERAAGTVTLQNVYAHGGTDAYTGTMTRTTCAHSSATVFTGSTASVAHSTANFVSVTSGSQDYHLITGSALIDAGTDLSGTFTTDIDGATRSGTWDIGADEFVGAVGGSILLMMMQL